jgi:ribA/ribD-fused uncharacterized protein
MALPIGFSSKTPDYAFLSNFYPAPFTLEGVEWPTVEHWFQAAKFPGDHEFQERIRGALTPVVAKRLGRTRRPTFRADWEEVKEAVMRQGLHAKFAQNPALANALAATGNRPLIERSSWDSYWGSGPQGRGKNRMGFLLMEVRDALAQNCGDAAPLT